MIFTSPWPSVAIPDISYCDFIFAHTSERADKPAFIDGPTGRTLTHGQVLSAARSVAAGLARKGLRKGDRVAIVSPNLPEYPVAFHGIALAGGVVTTANPLYRAEELAHQLADCGARFVVTVPAFLDNIRAASARTRSEEVFVFGEAVGASPFAALLDNEDTPPSVEIDPANDLLMLLYSSGTTGRPKGVMITHRNAVAMLSMSAPLLDEDISRQISLAVLPYFHAYGMTTMNGCLRYGLTHVTMPRFDFEQYLSLIERHRVTSLAVVPPILLALARHPAVAQHDLSSLEYIGCGAAPLSESVAIQASERLKVDVRQRYGMTETTVGCSAWARSEANRPGAVGRLLPNMEARIVDPSSAEELRANQRGELLVRGPNVMRGYLNNEAATASTLDADGWLHTGDVAMFDDDGYLYIVDRLKELIKVKGYQVAPAQLEAVLLQHPAIADAAVIGVPDDEAGELPKAFVVLRKPGTSAEAIIAETARQLAPYQRIRELEFVDAIPKSPSGKILRRELRARSATR